MELSRSASGISRLPNPSTKGSPIGRQASSRSVLMNVRTNDRGIDAAFIARKRVVIFDFDGTLADSVGWFCDVVNELARRYEFKETTPEQRDELRLKSPMEILSALGIPKWKLPAIAKHTRALAAQNIHRIKLFSWVGDLLFELKSNGMMIAVVSSNSAANIQFVLGPYASLIDHYETGSSLLGKSAKFKRVLKLLDVRPGEAVSVGDEVRDINAARRAGILSIGVAWGASHGDALVAAQATLAITPDDLKAFLLPQ
jgi:phosphoglycolate phosphatase